MKRAIAIRSICLGVALLGVVACSNVEFSSAPASVDCGPGCVTGYNNGVYDYTFNTGTLKTDMLFVVDNSASMYALQQQMGSKFPTLFNFIQGLDYHVGIINTDVTSAKNPSRGIINGMPYTQDGNLVPFSDGSPYLTSASVNPQNLFLQTITRQETLICQQYIAQNCDLNVGCSNLSALRYYCPSEETRAIYASILAVNRNGGTGFIRDASVPLNIVFLSNSDERASGGLVAGYPMETNDQPLTLISTVQQAFPGKQFKVHSIIIRPGDSSCYNSQYFGNTLFGWYGNYYAQLSNATGGVIGDVCAGDYSPTLTNIATSATSDNGSRDLPCTPIGAVDVTLQNGTHPPHTITTTSSGTPRIVFSPALGSNVTVHLHFECRQAT